MTSTSTLLLVQTSLAPWLSYQTDHFASAFFLPETKCWWRHRQSGLICHKTHNTPTAADSKVLPICKWTHCQHGKSSGLECFCCRNNRRWVQIWPNKWLNKWLKSFKTRLRACKSTNVSEQQCSLCVETKLQKMVLNLWCYTNHVHTSTATLPDILVHLSCTWLILLYCLHRLYCL